MSSPHYSSRAQDAENVYGKEKGEPSSSVQEDQVENRFEEITASNGHALNETELQVGDRGEASLFKSGNKHRTTDPPRLKNITVCIGRRKESKNWISDRPIGSSSIVVIPTSPVGMPKHDRWDRTIKRHCKRQRSRSSSTEEKHRKFSESKSGINEYDSSNYSSDF